MANTLITQYNDVVFEGNAVDNFVYDLKNLEFTASKQPVDELMLVGQERLDLWTEWKASKQTEWQGISQLTSDLEDALDELIDLFIVSQ